MVTILQKQNLTFSNTQHLLAPAWDFKSVLENSWKPGSGLFHMQDTILDAQSMLI